MLFFLISEFSFFVTVYSGLNDIGNSLEFGLSILLQVENKSDVGFEFSVLKLPPLNSLYLYLPFPLGINRVLGAVVGVIKSSEFHKVSDRAAERTED